MSIIMSGILTKTGNGTSGFQEFEPINDSNYVFVSKQLKKAFGKKTEGNNKGKWLVQRYFAIDKFIDSMLHRYFYMAAPRVWEDPFETKYIDYLNSELQSNISPEDLNELINMSMFCVCMTYNIYDNEEASWKAYGEKKEQIVRVTYDFNRLCAIIEKAEEKDLYIGKVDYKSRSVILTPNNVFEKGKKKPSNEEMFVNNFCLKQDAYKYEEELRFCKIMKGEQYKNEDSYRIEGIDLTPAITQITLPPINFNKISFTEEIEKKAKQHIKYLLLKTICPNVPIHVSNLYDKSQVDMTSEIKL